MHTKDEFGLRSFILTFTSTSRPQARPYKVMIFIVMDVSSYILSALTHIRYRHFFIAVPRGAHKFTSGLVPSTFFVLGLFSWKQFNQSGK